LDALGQGAAVNEAACSITGIQLACLGCQTRINALMATLYSLSVRIEAVLIA
jgi:hypothetical protein